MSDQSLLPIALWYSFVDSLSTSVYGLGRKLKSPGRASFCLDSLGEDRWLGLGHWIVSLASWENGVVGFPVEVQASSVVPGYLNESCYVMGLCISSISPRLGQGGHLFDSFGFTCAHPEPISSLLDHNLMWIASESCFPALLKAFWDHGWLTWLILGTTDPWALLACTWHSLLPKTTASPRWRH